MTDPKVKALDDSQERDLRENVARFPPDNTLRRLLATLDETRAQLAEAKAETRQLYELAFGKDAPCGKCGGKDFRIDGEAIRCTACGADLLACPACHATQARLTEAEGLLGEARAYVAAAPEHFRGILARIDAFRSPRPEPAKGGGA